MSEFYIPTDIDVLKIDLNEIYREDEKQLIPVAEKYNVSRTSFGTFAVQVSFTTIIFNLFNCKNTPLNKNEYHHTL